MQMFVLFITCRLTYVRQVQQGAPVARQYSFAFCLAYYVSRRRGFGLKVGNFDQNGKR